MGALSGGEPVFLLDGKLLAAVSKGTQVGNARFSLDGRIAPEVLPQSSPVIAGLSTNRKQTGWVWMASASDRAESLCFSGTLGGECKVLPTPDLTTQHFRAVKSQIVQWKNEGLSIEGLLYLPPESANRKVPLVVDVHGGPLGAWEDRYEEWTNFLIGHGWAILRPNPRGSSGYGVKFAAANKNDLGGADFRDVMTGVEEVVKKFPVDSSKLAAHGV